MTDEVLTHAKPKTRRRTIVRIASPADVAATVAENEDQAVHSSQERSVRPERTTQHIPRPPSTKQNPDAFFRYWSEVDKSHPDRLEVYVYRLWPVIDRTRTQSPNKAAAYVEIWRGAFDPETWRDEMLHRLGSGDYKLYLKDTVLKRGVCWTVVRGLNDPDYPPVVNINELVIEHPANRSYVEQLKMKGLIKQDASGETKPVEADKVSSEAVRELTGIVRKVLDEAIHNRGKDSGLERSIEIVGEAAKAQSQLLANAYREALSAQNPATVVEIVKHLVDAMQTRDKTDPTELVDKILSAYKQIKSDQPNVDPITMVEKVASTIEKISPKGPSYGEIISPVVELIKLQQSSRPNPNQEVVEMMRAMMEQQRSWSEQVIKLQQAQIEQMRQELQEARRQSADTSGITGVLETVARLKDQLSDLFTGQASERRIPDWVESLSKLSPIIAPVITALAQKPVQSPAVHPPVAVGTGHLPNPAMLPQPEPQPVAQGQAGQQAPATGMPQAHPSTVVQPSPSQQSGDILPGLPEAMARHLNDGRTGDEFAAALAEWYGMLAYQQIKNLGPDVLWQYVQIHPVLSPYATAMPNQTRKFIQEFVEAEKYWEQDQDQEQGEQEPEGHGVAPAPEAGRKSGRGQRGGSPAS